jgi:hypothetical protein
LAGSRSGAPQNLLCAALAVGVLVGLVANAAAGIWRPDRIVALSSVERWAEDLGYPEPELSRVPDETAESFAGVANPWVHGVAAPNFCVPSALFAWVGSWKGHMEPVIAIDVDVLRDELQKTYTEVSAAPEQQFIFPTGRAVQLDVAETHGRRALAGARQHRLGHVDPDRAPVRSGHLRG